MNRFTHARLARLLVAACGGLLAAAEACRVGKSQLQDYGSPHGEGFMPADVIADLEALCGEPIYSRALFEARPEAAQLRALADEACEATEAVTLLQKAARLAVHLSPAKRRELAALFEAAKRELAQVGMLIDGDAE